MSCDGKQYDDASTGEKAESDDRGQTDWPRFRRTKVVQGVSSDRPNAPLVAWPVSIVHGGEAVEIDRDT